MLILLIMQDVSPPLNNAPIFSLSELSQSLKTTVESAFGHIRVRAEISQPTRAASGHVYFTLKDDNATLDAICWKTTAAKLATQPEEGLEVIASGKLTTYPGRSKYQIVIKQLELAGEGALLKQLEERKQRLTAEGLFEAERKKAIPPTPQVIGIITSPTGAVIRDILHRLGERFPVHVMVWPVVVQGEAAAAEITAAIKGFDALLDADEPPVPIPDVVIVARGGGALEDLMAFNDEDVVRSVAACRLPLISAIGHETDTTLIDLAADLRAPTPTAAAEMATPVKADLTARINEFDTRLTRQLDQHLEQSRQHLHGLDRRLGDPDMVITSKTQRLDLSVSSIDRKLDQMLTSKVERLRHYASRLIDPDSQLIKAQSRLTLLTQRLQERIDHKMTHSTLRFEQAARLLDAASFQRVLQRGFALITGPDGQVMRSSSQYDDGTEVTLRVADGTRQASLEGNIQRKIESKTPPKTSSKTSPKTPLKNDEQEDLF
jgi:exodeoxyribonuclease VII large subunit